MAFLIESQIPTDKWPSLLGSNSLGSAMVNGKGGSADGISDRIADSDRQVALASWQWRLARRCGEWEGRSADGISDRIS